MATNRPMKRYALARTTAGRSQRAEGLRRLRLVRMEAIADLDRPGAQGAGQPGSSAVKRS